MSLVFFAHNGMLTVVWCILITMYFNKCMENVRLLQHFINTSLVFVWLRVRNKTVSWKWKFNGNGRWNKYNQVEKWRKVDCRYTSILAGTERSSDHYWSVYIELSYRLRPKLPPSLILLEKLRFPWVFHGALLPISRGSQSTHFVALLLDKFAGVTRWRPL